MGNSEAKPAVNRDAFPSPLQEYSVIYTDRSLNLMAKPFTETMQRLSGYLKKAYNTDNCVIIPGSGSYGMEAIARQLAVGEHVVVLRNGYFSYRWSDIFERCDIPASCTVLKGSPVDDGPTPYFQPHDLESACATIRAERPKVVFAPHVETSTGILLTPEYIKGIADATHEVGGLFVLDGIAAGTMWVDMAATGADVYLTAPQKGWTSPASCGVIMLSSRARAVVEVRNSNSMVLSVKDWMGVMDEYEAGGFAYFTTLPTDSLVTFENMAAQTVEHGLEKAKTDLVELGTKVRAKLEARGYKSVAAPGWQSPGVVVSYTNDYGIVGKLKANGVQVATGVPLKLGEKPPPETRWRIGLFGLDKLKNIDGTVKDLMLGLDRAVGPKNAMVSKL